MCLVHDDGTVLVQVGLPKRLPQKNTVCHVLDERGLEGGGRVEGEGEEEEKERGWKRKRRRQERKKDRMEKRKKGDNFHLGNKTLYFKIERF